MSSSDSPPRNLLSPGYGDFAFAKWLVGGRVVKNRYQSLDITEGSDFIRHGIFPFYELSVEIRNKILGEIRRPLLETKYDQSTKHFIEAKFLKIVIKDNRLSVMPDGKRQVLVSNLLDRGILDEQVAWATFTEEERLRVWGSFFSFEEYFVTAKDFARPAATPHPFRLDNSNYRADLAHVNEYDPRFQPWQAYVDWVRKALYVSARFRKDLEEILWQDIEIFVDRSSCMPGLVNFLQVRPKIIRKLRKLELHLRPYTYLIPDIPTVERGLQYLAKNVELEELILLVIGDEKEIEQLAKGTGKLCYLNSIKDISVKKSFLVKSPVAESEKRVRRIGDLIRPHTLRIQAAEPTNEVEQYLADQALLLKNEVNKGG